MSLPLLLNQNCKLTKRERKYLQRKRIGKISRRVYSESIIRGPVNLLEFCNYGILVPHKGIEISGIELPSKIYFTTNNK